MHIIKRLNYTGRRIWFVENVLTALFSFWVNYPVLEEGGREREKEREGNLQVCFSKQGFFSFNFKGLHWVSQ